MTTPPIRSFYINRGKGFSGAIKYFITVQSNSGERSGVWNTFNT